MSTMQPSRVLAAPGTIFVLCLSSCFGALGADSSPRLPAWISTGTLSADELSTRYFGQYDLTPSVTTNVPDASAYSNSSFKLQIRNREAIVMRISAKGSHGGKLVASYDVRLAGRPIESADMPREEIHRIWETNQPLFMISYYRGHLFWTYKRIPSDDWITLFASEDCRRLVFVRDSGPIWFSDDSGISWNSIKQPGHYECTLSTSPKGSVVVATLELGQYTAANVADEAFAEGRWYSEVSAADGSKLVLAGGASQSAPVLRITSTGESIYLSWPAASTGFQLQKSTDLATSHWVEVTNSANVVGSQFVVTLPVAENNNFFRLEHHDAPR